MTKKEFIKVSKIENNYLLANEKDFPTFAPMYQIMEFSEEVAKKMNYSRKRYNKIWNLKDNPRDILFDIAEHFNIKIVYRHDMEDIGLVINKKKKKYIIYLSGLNTEARTRFDLARHLGHFLLHKDTTKHNKIHFNRHMDSNRLLWEANWFAQGLLVNKEDFITLREELAKKKMYNYWLGIYFGVSEIAIESRIRILDMEEKSRIKFS